MKKPRFKDRRVYDVGGEGFSPAHEADIKKKKLMLFTTPTCANCSFSKKALSDAGIDYEVMDAVENRELIEKYGILQAPTLVVLSGEGTDKFYGFSGVKEYISSVSQDTVLSTF